MTNDERRSYMRGYMAGKSCRWPSHFPPTPPLPVVAEWKERADCIASAISAYIEAGDANEDLVREFRAALAGYEVASSRVTQWLLSGDEKWAEERGAAIRSLRSLCREKGDNEWDESLHLQDIIEKHLADHLLANR